MAAFETPPDEVLVRYLLGELPAAEADPLDERSVADPEFFERLEALENDLADSYARGEMPRELEDRFTRGYANTPDKAARVRFAAALAQRQQRTARVLPMTPRGRRVMPWLLPAAAAIAIVGIGLWILPQTGEVSMDQPTQQAAQTEQAPAPQPPPTATTPPEQAPPSVTQRMFAFTLAAPRRGVDDLPMLTVPADATDVTLRLELEIDDYPRYRAALKDPASGRVLWRSGVLTSERQRTPRAVPVAVSARQFEPQRYFMELEGVTASGSAEPIATYAFRVVR